MNSTAMQEREARGAAPSLAMRSKSPTQRIYDSAITEDVGDWAAHIVEKYPKSFQYAMSARYASLTLKNKNQTANIWLRDTHAELSKASFRLAADDQELKDKATACARRCRGMSYIQAKDYCDFEGVLINKADDDNERRYAVARAQCPRWWLRKLRKLHGQTVEKAAIQLNLVSQKRGKYCSNEAVKMHRGQVARNTALLEMLEATNTDTGQKFSLAELSAVNVSNPLIRRAELMVRMRGFEDYAKKRNHVAMFYTVTAPSKYHASLSETGNRNPKYKDFTPRDTQSYLSKLWARIRAKLARLGAFVYGFRVAEPHHDGTPHWHLLLFMEPVIKVTVTKIMEEYAKAEDNKELRTANQNTARFKPVEIDPKRGSATGYIAKYIAKNVGHVADTGMTEDLYGNDIAEYCERVKAWSSRWGIRQFQQIGGASVTVWRELRRLDTIKNKEATQAEQIRAAADMGQWDLFTERMGGVECPRDARPVKIQKMRVTEPSMYGEPMERIVGVRWGHLPFISRLSKWVVDFAPPAKQVEVSGRASGSPWSSVNNCTGVQQNDISTASERGTHGIRKRKRGAVATSCEAIPENN